MLSRWAARRSAVGLGVTIHADSLHVQRNYSLISMIGQTFPCESIEFGGFPKCDWANRLF